MKQFFLWAAAISALCSSCETANETFLEENNETLQTTQQRLVSDYNVYENVVNSFVYNKQLLHYSNLLLFEEHVNTMIQNKDTYESIDFNQLDTLKNANKYFIEQLNYSNQAKNAITAIINKTFDPATLTLITDTEEHRLITTLYEMDHNGNGDDGDDSWKDRKTIAFAYGAQYNLTRAVLYAGAVHLEKYK